MSGHRGATPRGLWQKPKARPGAADLNFPEQFAASSHQEGQMQKAVPERKS
jgi:hypothetical protein